MKLLPSMSGKPANRPKEDNALKFHDVEGLNGPVRNVQGNQEETPEVPWAQLSQKEKVKMLGASVWANVQVFLVVFFVMGFLCTPSSVESPNPNPIRHVYLNKTAAGFGVALHGNRIVSVLSGSAAAQSGDLNINDEITSVNGINTRHTWTHYVIDLMNIRDDDVKLTVVAKSPDVPLYARLLEVFKLSLLPYFAIVCFMCMFYAEEGGTTRTVTLNKANGHYGMMIKGSTVYEVIPGGAAEAQGNIQKWEEIVRINGVHTSRMSTETILELLETRPNEVTLLIRNRD